MNAAVLGTCYVPLHMQWKVQMMVNQNALSSQITSILRLLDCLEKVEAF